MTTYYVNVPDRLIKFHEGWLDHKTQGKWIRYWCVLRNNIIFIFNSDRTALKESHVGTLTLGPESKLEERDDDGTGCRFDLYTRKKLNRFKALKPCERDLWKAFVNGIATGKVPDSLNLLPGQIEDVRQLLSHLFGDQQPPPLPASGMRRQSSESSTFVVQEGFDTPNSSSDGSFPVSGNDESYLVPATPRKPSAKSNAQERIFYSDPSKTDPPSWFFSNCSRDLAQKILTVGTGYGNTLMRESTHPPFSLVISKRLEFSGNSEFAHYKVESTQQGYKVDVENVHEPMRTLSEVMAFFKVASGQSTTRPMVCNNLKELGIRDPVENDYNSKIERVSILLDADNGEKNIKAAQTARASVFRNITSVRGINYDQNASRAPPAPPPPAPHLNTCTVSATKQHKTMGPRGGWNARSKSVPQICPAVLTEIQTEFRLKASGQTVGPPLYINTSSKGTPLAQAISAGRNKIPSPPALPPNHPSTSVPPAPPLPGNHPPQRRRSHDMSAAPNSLARKPTPKHSHSMSSADEHHRNTVLKQSLPASDDKKTVNSAAEDSSSDDCNIPSPGSAQTSIPTNRISNGVYENRSDIDDFVIVYAQIRKTTPPSCSHSDYPSKSYHNCEGLKKSDFSRGYMAVSNAHDNPVMNYVEMSRESKNVVLASKEELYEPVEDSNQVNKDGHDVVEQSIIYTNDKPVSDDQILDVSAETYEPMENMTMGPGLNSPDERFQHSKANASVEMTAEQENDIFQTITFTNRPGPPQVKKKFHSKENNFPATSLSLEDTCQLKEPRQRKIGYVPTATGQNSDILQMKEMFEAKDNDKIEKSEENEIYEVIQFETSKVFSGVQMPHSVSTPDEIYEGVEWKHPYSFPYAALSTTKNNDNKKCNDERTSHGDFRRTNTIASPFRPVSSLLNDCHYAEATHPAVNSISNDSFAQYIDVIANYEDIKAAKAARGSFSGPSANRPQEGPCMRRSKSEICRPSMVEVTQSFKEKLEGLLGNQITPPGQVPKTFSSPYQDSAVNISSDVYENIDQYQSVMKGTK